MPNRQRSDGRLLKAAAAFFTLTASLAVAQTRITPPKNKYTCSLAAVLSAGPVDLSWRESGSIEKAPLPF